MRVVCVVYVSSLVPLLLVIVLHSKRRIPEWVLPVYLGAFCVCAIGWELWFTYGWVGGDSVNIRRAADLNAAIPMHVNWIVNSLADAGSICLFGLILVWRCFGDPRVVLMRWHWGAFFVLLVWFLCQNIFVEMFLYHDQLAEGKPLSWAPLAPTGPWLNPTLFEFNGRTITLQGQMPWLLGTPIFCGALVVFFRWCAERDLAKVVPDS